MAKLTCELMPGRAVVLAAPLEPNGRLYHVLIWQTIEAPRALTPYFRRIFGAPQWVAEGPDGVLRLARRAAAWERIAAETATPAEDKWARRLPGGDVIRLTAVSRPKELPFLWWTPDGAPTLPPKRPDLTAMSGPLRLALQCDFAPPGEQLSLTDFTDDAKGEPALDVGIGEGPWKEIGRFGVEGGEVTADGITYRMEKPGVLRRKSRQFEGLTTATIRYARRQANDVTLVAIGRDGKDYPLPRTIVTGSFPDGVDGIMHGIMHVDILDVDHFSLRSRPMHWVKFEGFAVKPAVAVPELGQMPEAKASRVTGSERVPLVAQPIPLLSEEAKCPQDASPSLTRMREQVMFEVSFFTLSADRKMARELANLKGPVIANSTEGRRLIAQLSGEEGVAKLETKWTIPPMTESGNFAGSRASYVAGYERSNGKEDDPDKFSWIPTIGEYEPAGRLLKAVAIDDGHDVRIFSFKFKSVAGELAQCKGKVPVIETQKEVTVAVSEPVVRIVSAKIDQSVEGLRVKPGEFVLLPTKSETLRYASNLRSLNPTAFEAGECPASLLSDTHSFVIVKALVVVTEELVPDGPAAASSAPRAAVPTMTGEELVNGKMSFRQYDVADILIAWGIRPHGPSETFVRTIAQFMGPQNWDRVLSVEDRADKLPTVSGRALILREDGYLMVNQSGFIHKRIEGILADFRETAKEPFLMPGGAQSIEGKALSTDKIAAKDARVFLFSVQKREGAFLRCKDDGSFAFAGVSPGEYFLWVTSAENCVVPAYDPAKHEESVMTIELKEGESRRGIAFVLKPK